MGNFYSREMVLRIANANCKLTRTPPRHTHEPRSQFSMLKKRVMHDAIRARARLAAGVIRSLVRSR